jgi:hypothetical protein
MRETLANIVRLNLRVVKTQLVSLKGVYSTLTLYIVIRMLNLLQKKMGNFRILRLALRAGLRRKEGVFYLPNPALSPSVRKRTSGMCWTNFATRLTALLLAISIGKQ